MGTTVKIMLNTDRSHSNGSFPLVIRILHNRRKKMIYTSHHLFLSDFDATSQRVLSGMYSELTRKKAAEINAEMSEKKNIIEQILTQFSNEGNHSYTIEDIICRFENHHPTSGVLTYINREIALMRETGRFGSASLYASTRNSLKRFLKNRKLLFTNFNSKFISDYSAYLHESDLSQNTVNMYLANLRTVYYKAQKEGLFFASISPFEDVDIRISQSAKCALSRESICRIAYADFSYDKSLDLVRDIFMFSFYSAGMSFRDIVHLRSNQVVGDKIYYKCTKSNSPAEVHITPFLRALITKYHTDNSPFIFPVLFDDTSDLLYKQYRNALNAINYNLKRIGTLLDLELKLTTQVARHSWKQIIKTEGVYITEQK